ncbi:MULTISPECIES: YgaP family membrane protein [Pseudomonadaceae]|uniref:Inner membrane protein YgaP-like transmembrane domain-containing protein n=2 Tax=Ectopseudomonas TaxID=3236654 RepID=A4XUP1_ECTM1|nr:MULTISPECIES: DUF2892 domain-containing protein [Pseudomonas]ARS48952.1 hypothetical protein PSMEN_11295 [Pseudomonas mendocina]EJO91685.1 hypothetical protein A471_22198 [Pseudomonas mendocina DLHK]MBA4244276.1 DUF2892 domain-containing protein [Pseudomonas sp.]MBF8163705.1 DUF2892 domain-containing protein [Pseudomonas mendocina]MDH0098295.1 DUF2892 domain-containing protein [Pseudomonas sp. GD04158]
MSLSHNVQRLERAISLATGATAVVTGLCQGGSRGVLKALGGAALLQRGFTGHCVVKGMISDPKTELEGLRQCVADLRAALPRLQKELEAVQQRQTAPGAREARLDNAVEETFPASDPISP